MYIAGHSSLPQLLQANTGIWFLNRPRSLFHKFNYKQHSLSREPVSLPVFFFQNIFNLLWTRKFHYRVHKSRSLDATLNQKRPAHDSTSQLFKINFNSILASVRKTQAVSPLYIFKVKFFRNFLLSTFFKVSQMRYLMTPSVAKLFSFDDNVRLVASFSNPCFTIKDWGKPRMHENKHTEAAWWSFKRTVFPF